MYRSKDKEAGGYREENRPFTFKKASFYLHLLALITFVMLRLYD